MEKHLHKFSQRSLKYYQRTIMRDMETLEQAGIPIQSMCGIDGGYQVLDIYIMDNHLTNTRDYSFIYTALKGLASAYSNKDIEQTLKKIVQM